MLMIIYYYIILFCFDFVNICLRGAHDDARTCGVYMFLWFCDFIKLYTILPAHAFIAMNNNIIRFIAFALNCFGRFCSSKDDDEKTSVWL